MVRATALLGLGAFLAVIGPHEGRASAAQGSEARRAMSEDARRMHENLVALSKGEGSISDLRVEFMDGGMSSHRSFAIEAGKLVSKQWESPGARMIQREGRVDDARVRKLLEQLIARQYWTFEGTRFVPDAPIFLFRFHYGDLKHVDFRCDAEELQRSETRTAIRDLFLKFASETEMKPS
jgi:hypothetical protein